MAFFLRGLENGHEGGKGQRHFDPRSMIHPAGRTARSGASMNGLGWGEDFTMFCAQNPTDPKCGGGAAPMTFQVMAVKPTSMSVGAVTQQSPTPGTNILIASPKPWYKTWWGLLGIGAAAFGAYKLMSK